MESSTVNTVVVRDRDRVWRADRVEEWDLLTLICSASADPRNFDELSRAFLRYRPGESLDQWQWRDQAGGPPEVPWVVIDLVTLRVFAGGGFELPEQGAAYEPDEWNDEDGPRPVVWANLPPDWRQEGEAEWSGTFAPLPVPAEPLDVRGVLFGRALADGIARRAWELAQRDELPAELPLQGGFEGEPWPPAEDQRRLLEQWRALTVGVHADWLMTPRDDLEGQPPRVYLHRGRQWVEREMDHRQQQWTQEGGPSRPLDRDTYAFRYGPLGRNEVVLYFDLCRDIIAHAWHRLVGDRAIGLASLSDALHQRAKSWMVEPHIESTLSPAEIIEHERRRLPLVEDGSHLDCDCPICRMQAEGVFGPMFFGYDGFHLELDGQFAFSLHSDPDQWQEEQENLLVMKQQIEAETRQHQPQSGGEIAADATESRDVDDAFGDIWQRSMVDWEAMLAPGMPPEMLTMGIGMMASELVADLQDSGGDPQLVDRLNAAFQSYRHAASDRSGAEAARGELVDALERIAEADGQLTAKAADLQSRLAELQRCAS